MNEDEARSHFLNILDSLEVTRGDVLYLGINIGRVPLPSYPISLNREAVRERERRWCEFVYSCLMSVIGDAGTLLVPTFTYTYAASNIPYVHEESPSETGPFTEFIRKLPNSHRSLHPIHSIAGVGRNVADIVGNVGKAAYGAMSAFARLTPHGAKFLCLGTSIGDSLTYVHHLEQVYGSNHRYNKVFDTPVIRDGRHIPGPWLCYLRYLGVAARPRISNIEKELRSQKMLREISYDDYPNQVAHSSDVDRVGLSMLSENPCAFVSDAVRIYLDESATIDDPSNDAAVRFSLNQIKE